MSKSTVIMALSGLTAIFGAAGMAATNSLAYLSILVVSVIGLIAGALIADDEQRQAEADRQFSNRLNK